MNVITKKRIRAFMDRHPDAATALQAWYGVARKAAWTSLQDVRRIYPHADLVTVGSGNKATVFNVGGNKYRLIAAIHYNAKRLYILRILPHAEYSKGFWKDAL
jgi:mRNA interferase HigB